MRKIIKHNVVLTSFLILFSVFLGTMFSSDVHADIYTDLVRDYGLKGYKAPTSSEITKVVGGVEYIYRIGQSNTETGKKKVVSNVFYKAKDGKRIRSVYHSRISIGSNQRQVEAISETGSNRETFKDASGTTLADTNGNVVMISKKGNYVMEFHMGPSQHTDTIETNANIWNNTGGKLKYGVIYGHDTQLGDDSGSPEDNVPIYSLGPGRGLYIESTNKAYRLNYTMERYKKPKKINYSGLPHGDHHPTQTFNSFTGPNPTGAGNGDEAPFNPAKPIKNNVDTAVLFKLSPEDIDPGEKISLTFYTGIEEGLSRPLLFADEPSYKILEGTPNLDIGIDWYDFGNEGGELSGVLTQNDLPISDTQTKTLGAQGEGHETFNVITQDLPVGTYVYKLKIKTKKTNQYRDLNVPIIVIPKLLIQGYNNQSNQAITGANFGSVDGEVDNDYSQEVSLIYNNKYILDKKTPNLQTDGKTVKGKVKQTDIDLRAVRVNYYPVPTLTANPVADIKETDNVVEITGNWTDATKAGGKVEIKKGTTSVGSTTYAANVANGTWKVTVPKEQLAIGQNNLTVTLSHGYSSYTTAVPVTVHRQKHVKINYYLFKNGEADTLLPDNILTDLPRVADKRVGDVVTVEAKPFLEGQKYKFDPIKSGIPGGSGFTVTTNVTATLNEVKVYYVLNQVPVEIQYNNIETGKAIFAGLDTTTRKPAKPLGLQIVGTDVNTLIQALDKDAKGYDFHSIKVKKGNTDVQNGQVGDEPTVITILFTPKFNIEPPTLDFGRHKLSVFDTTKTLEGNPEVKITNTRETAAGKITPWKVTGNFSGFTIGTQTELASELKFGNASFNGGNEVTIDSVAVPTAGEKKIPLNSKMKLDVTGGGTIVGDYEGTMTWTLTDAL